VAEGGITSIVSMPQFMSLSHINRNSNGDVGEAGLTRIVGLAREPGGIV
jgi:hypothetical protein